VHKPTLEAVQRVWQAGGGVLGTPRRDGPLKPPKPFPDEFDSKDATVEELETFRRWKRKMVRYYDEHRSWRSRVRELGSLLRAAQQDLPEMYFPTYVDKRSRWYYRGIPNPQGSDLSKAILHFSDKKALGARGLFWLK